MYSNVVAPDPTYRGAELHFGVITKIQLLCLGDDTPEPTEHCTAIFDDGCDQSQHLGRGNHTWQATRYFVSVGSCCPSRESPGLHVSITD
jgi:hypothetical protein